MIDLHVHSTYSDGSLTPAELVDAARAAGLAAVGLTDHDCTDGLDPFLAACAQRTAGDPELIGVPGVEISADVKRGTMHVLGYYFDARNERLMDVLEQIRDGRRIRNEKILGKLNAAGLALTWDEVASLAGEDVVGRPHFAQAMVARGYARDNQQVFDRFLAKGKPAYVDRFRLPPAESVKVIREAGGVAVLAHPFTLELKPAELRAFVAELKEQGLGGIEAVYSEYSPQQEADYRALAREFDLAMTGGSDFHGQQNPAIKLGRGFGGLNVPDDFLASLQARSGR